MFKEMKSEAALIQDQVIKFDKSSITLNLQRVIVIFSFLRSNLQTWCCLGSVMKTMLKSLEYYVTLCKPWVNSLRAHNRILQGLFTCQPCPASLKSSHTYNSVCAFPTAFFCSFGRVVCMCVQYMHEFLQVIWFTFTRLFLVWTAEGKEEEDTIFGKCRDQAWRIVLPAIFTSPLSSHPLSLTLTLRDVCNYCKTKFHHVDRLRKHQNHRNDYNHQNHQNHQIQLGWIENSHSSLILVLFSHSSFNYIRSAIFFAQKQCVQSIKKDRPPLPPPTS